MNHRKIAQLASVSASTVSKALSGSAEVSKETTERFQMESIIPFAFVTLIWWMTPLAFW